MTTIRGEGHMRPLLPFADAFRELGHEVLIAIPETATGLVLDAGHEPWALPEAPAELSDAVSARGFAAAKAGAGDEANRIIVGELFAGVHARASLPGIMGAVAEWQPDVLMHETCEFAAALVAERAALPSVRVAVHMAELERYIAEFAAADVDEIRAEQRLDPDPDGLRLLGGRSVTLTPPALDGGRREGHFREPHAPLMAPPGPWDGDERPLVYVSYGTVAPQGDAYPGLYREAIEQLAALDVRVLLNTGRRDPAELGPLPAGVHAEPWVREASVLPARGGDALPRRRRLGAHGALGRRAAGGAPALRRPAAQRARRRQGGRGAGGRGRQPDRRARRRAADGPALRGHRDRHRLGGRLAAAGGRGDRGPARAPRGGHLSLNARMRSS